MRKKLAHRRVSRISGIGAMAVITAILLFAASQSQAIIVPVPKAAHVEQHPAFNWKKYFAVEPKIMLSYGPWRRSDYHEYFELLGLRDDVCQPSTRDARLHPYLSQLSRLMESYESAVWENEKSSRELLLGIRRILRQGRETGPACSDALQKVYLAYSAQLIGEALESGGNRKGPGDTTRIEAGDTPYLAIALMYRGVLVPEPASSEREFPKLLGAHDCWTSKLSVSTRKAPLDTGGVILHELSHLFFDHELGNSVLNDPRFRKSNGSVSWNALLLLDETLAYTYSAYAEYVARPLHTPNAARSDGTLYSLTGPISRIFSLETPGDSIGSESLFLFEDTFFSAHPRFFDAVETCNDGTQSFRRYSKADGDYDSTVLRPCTYDTKQKRTEIQTSVLKSLNRLYGIVAQGSFIGPFPSSDLSLLAPSKLASDERVWRRKIPELMPIFDWNIDSPLSDPTTPFEAIDAAFNGLGLNDSHSQPTQYCQEYVKNINQGALSSYRGAEISKKLLLDGAANPGRKGGENGVKGGENGVKGGVYIKACFDLSDEI